MKGKRRDTLIVLVVFLALLAVVFLLKRTGIIDTVLEPGKTDRAQKREISLKIKDLVIEPEKPNSSSIVRVVPVVETNTGGRVAFHYRWFVNDEEIFDMDQAVLPGQFLRKNNRIYCRVTARMGIHESREKRSKQFVVANSPPELIQQPVKKFSVPGTFYHQFKASDPDGDPIEFRLIAPLGKGIEVDSRSGEVRWDIPELARPEPTPARGTLPVSEGEDAVPREPVYPETDESGNQRVVIMVEVRDADGAVTVASLELDLLNGREVTH